MARLPGVSRAAPAPWRTRVMIKNSTSGASPHAAEATANHAVPIRYTFRRPKRSPSDPPISRNAASVSV
jgi:hypothetical protein